MHFIMKISRLVAVTAPILIALISLSSCNEENKLAYVDIGRIYNEISISKKYQERLSFLQNNYETRIQVEKKALQKAKKESSQSFSQIELKELFILQNKVDSLADLYALQLKDSAALYNKELEERVNNLVYDFGKQSEYDYIFSPGSSNGFMYADTLDDITVKVIQFIESNTK